MSNLKLPLKQVRADAGAVAFNEGGKLVQVPAPDSIAPGGDGPVLKKSRSGAGLVVGLEDGSLVTQNVEASASFENDGVLSGRDVEFDTTLVQTSDAQQTSLFTTRTDVTAGNARSVMMKDPAGNGTVHSLAVLAPGSLQGAFTAQATPGDYEPGDAPDFEMAYRVDGSRVYLHATALAQGDAAGTSLSWPAGTLPVLLRPVATVTVQMVVRDAGVDTIGTATFNPNGSVQFRSNGPAPVTPTVVYEKIASPDGYSGYTSVWRAPAGVTEADFLLVGPGAMGGRGYAYKGGVHGGAGGGAGGLCIALGVPVTPGVSIPVRVGRGQSAYPSGTTYTLPADLWGRTNKRLLTHPGLDRTAVFLPPEARPAGFEGNSGIIAPSGGTGAHAHRGEENGRVGADTGSAQQLAAGTLPPSCAGSGGGAGPDVSSNPNEGGSGFKSGGDSSNTASAQLDDGSGAGGGGRASGTAGEGKDATSDTDGVGGDGGDGVSLASLGWGDAVAAVGAPAVVCAGGGGSGQTTAGAGGSSGVGGNGTNTQRKGYAGAADTGSGGGGGLGDHYGGKGAGGLILIRYNTYSSTGPLATAGFSAGLKGLPAGAVVSYPLNMEGEQIA